MSLKRAPTSELNHDNWDDDNPEDHEDMGAFKIAPKDVIEKRVMRTAKRRSQLTSNEPKKNVFSGFGFNKTQPSSFDFLAKLTNGSNDSNSTATKTDPPATSSLFSSKPLATNTGSSSIFGQLSSTPSKSPFGSPSSQTKTESLFGTGSNNTTFGVFSPSKVAESKDETTFKIQSDTSSDKQTESPKLSANLTKFTLPTSTNVAKPMFSTTSNSTPLKIPTSATMIPSNINMATKPESDQIVAANKSEETKDEKKLQYYSKLKGLNESVSDWIKKHVEQTPLCILSPIFKDYEAYLKQIQGEYEGADKKEESKKTEIKILPDTNKESAIKPFVSSTTSLNTSSNSTSLFGSPTTGTTKSESTSKFSFGIAPSTGTSNTVSTSSAGFAFGTNVSSVPATSSLFSLGTTTTSSTTTTNGTGTKFSFGIGQPFSFSSNVKQAQNTEKTEEANEEDDTPPKVEYAPIAEKNSVFDKKCKIFVKKDGNFVDKGVGTLYIKKVEETGKHQFLVRANNSLGTILVNLILASAIPTQRTGKNNVMMVCIPTPDSKPPPTPVLIRVKTSEEADELLETLNKYKT